MHRKIMRVMVDCSVVFGAIIAWLLAWAVGTALDNTGVGILIFIIAFCIIVCGLASEGMKVEQAENIAKIAENTELLIKMQKDSSTRNDNTANNYTSVAAVRQNISTETGNSAQNMTNRTSMLSRTTEGVKTGTTWICSKCLEKNASSSQFCMTCGNKKPYC